MNINVSEDIKKIQGTLSNLLKNKFLIFCITGSVAIYKIPDIIRQVIRHGAYVQVFMSKKASEFINPIIFEWASGNKVLIEPSGKVEYISHVEKCDGVCLIPATGNTISKIVNSITDNLITLTISSALGLNKPILIVPVMNLALWNNPFFKENLEKLKMFKNIKILEPKIEEGKAKIPDINEIVESIIDLVNVKDMYGVNVLVISGPTREHIDPVKYITTPSSGITGIYFAREAYSRGANVTLITGPIDIEIPKFIETYHVTSAVEMYECTRKILENRKFDIIVVCAAPVDYTPIKKFNEKIKSDYFNEIELRLVRTPKIIKLVRELAKNSIVIGFKAEWNVNENELIRVAFEKLHRDNLDLIIAHDVSKGFGFKTIHDNVYIIDKFGNIENTGIVHKRELARKIFTKVLTMLHK